MKSPGGCPTSSILLRSVGDPEVIVARVGSGKERDIVLTLAAIGAALAIPCTRIGEFLIACGEKSKRRLSE